MLGSPPPVKEPTVSTTPTPPPENRWLIPPEAPDAGPRPRWWLAERVRSGAVATIAVVAVLAAGAAAGHAVQTAGSSSATPAPAASTTSAAVHAVPPPPPADDDADAGG